MTESEFPPTPAHAKAESTSLGDLLGEVTQDISTLIRQEVELAKVELKQSATRAGRGAGMLAGAGVAGHFVLLFLSLALWYALGGLIGLGWSAVVVAVLWAIIAAVLATQGRSQLKSVKGMPQTAETIQEIPETLKPREEQR
ncbi:phage holin family protein [Arthrobacter sp. NPDC058127]|uniref:phage holin family protein n=1 Tax=Arthrobacter sp. NPDC058127 TaxID=3346351 RepID=UPI0036EB539A